MLLGLLNKLLKLTKPSFHPQNGFVPLELICPDYSQHLIVYDARERFTYRSAVYRACHARFLQSTTQPEFPTQGLSHHETSRQEWRPSLRVLDNNCPRSILCVMRREWDARSQRWFCASSPTCAHYTRSAGRRPRLSCLALVSLVLYLPRLDCVSGRYSCQSTCPLVGYRNSEAPLRIYPIYNIPFLCKPQQMTSSPHNGRCQDLRYQNSSNLHIVARHCR